MNGTVILDRIDALMDELEGRLTGGFGPVVSENGEIRIAKGNTNVCTVFVQEECYCLKTTKPGWKEVTSYSGTVSDGVFCYYVDSLDECLGEVERMLSYSPKQGSSQLRQMVTEAAFTTAYKSFMEQAEKNARTGKAEGSKIPNGFVDKPKCDGAEFNAQYGQGAASRAPYMHWWAVSIYYSVADKKIVMGIEEDRYPYMKDMHPVGYEWVGNKNVHVFYQDTKDTVDFTKLYNSFMDTCEEVMRLGLK